MVDIVQVLLSPRIGGAETLVARLERSWADSGIQSSVIYLDAGLERKSRLSRLRDLRRTLRAMDPVIVVSHSAIPNFYVRLAASLSLPVVTVLHSASDDYQWWPMRVAERILRLRTAWVVSVSQVQHSLYAKHFGRRVPTSVIYTGIAESMTPKRSFSPRPVRVVSVARVAQQKNPGLWLKVAESAATRYPDLEFVWWGPASNEPGIAEILDRSKVTPNARFEGPTDNPASAYLQADVLLHTSSREAPGIALIEAAACGVPVICSDTVSPSLPTIVPRTEYRDNDAMSVLGALDKVISDWATVNEFSQSKAIKIGEMYSAKATAAEYEDIFRAIAGQSWINRA
jgi:glycosyltransferase involved in cell wall biosynthesis